MKKGKSFFEKENLLIYLGTAIFFVLAIAIGIIMYMTSNKNTELGKTTENNTVEKHQEVEENTESASTNIGKTVEEQENNTTNSGNIIKEEQTESKDTNSTTTNSSGENEAIDAEQIVEKNTESNATQEIPQKTETETKKEITFVKPTEGEIICEFAKENLIYSETLKEWITHTAVDIKADKTSVIKSAADGIIKSIVNDPRYGLTVVIEHDEGYETVYSNLLTAEFVVEGEEVTQGQTIGTAGNTAAFESSMECHLHFELLKDGEYVDPTIYLK